MRKNQTTKQFTRSLLSVIILVCLLLASCITTKKTTYLQEDKEETEAAIAAPEEYRVQINDNLFVRIITPDPKWAAMFNTLPVTASSFTMTELTADLISYPVTTSGTIDMPFLGEIEVAGKTIPQIKKEIHDSLVDYIKDYDVSVRLVNNYVSVLGEVSRPGKYPIYKNHLTILQALAMASDLNEYSNRRRVQVIRQTPEGPVVKEFDLTDRNLVDTEFYYVKPNDVIYAQPIKGKFFRMNQFPFALILSAITTTVLFLNYLGV